MALPLLRSLKKPLVLQHENQISEEPWNVSGQDRTYGDNILMDMCDPFKVYAPGCIFILIMMDNFTSYQLVRSIPDKKSNMIAEEFLEGWYFVHGTPSQLHADNELEFKSAHFEDLCRVLGGVRKTHSPTYIVRYKAPCIPWKQVEHLSRQLINNSSK